MKYKSLWIVLLLVSLVAGGALMVNAQEDDAADEAAVGKTTQFFGRGTGLQLGDVDYQALLEEYTGLAIEELYSVLEDGATLAALIEANNQDVEAFTAAVLDELEANLNAAVEAYLADAESRIAEQLNGIYTFSRNSDGMHPGAMRGGAAPGMRGRGGRGGFPGGDDVQPDNTQPDDTGDVSDSEST